MVVGQERRDLGNALGDGAPEEDLRIIGQLVADDQVEVAEAEREHQPRDRVADPDAGGAAPGGGCPALGIGPAVGLERIVELVGSRAGHDVVVLVRLAEVDARLADRQLRIAVDPAHQVVRRALVGHGVDRHGGDAVAVRVDEALVGPGARLVGQPLDVELASAEHDLAVLVRDLVAIDVDVEEGVVAPQDLLLAERRQQRPVVPQPQVVDRRGVLREHLARQLLLAGEAALLDGVEVEGRAGGGDVPGDVRALHVELVRVDLDGLHEGRVQAADDDRQDQPRAGRPGRAARACGTRC